MLRGGREKPWGPVLIAMSNGHFAFAVAADGRRLIDRVYVDPADMNALLSLRFERRDHSYAYSATMPRRDAQDVLNLTPSLLMQSLSSDLKHCIVQDGLLAVAGVLHLARTRIGGGEVLARWGRGRILPLPLRDVRRFPRLGPTGWSRNDVETALNGSAP